MERLRGIRKETTYGDAEKAWPFTSTVSNYAAFAQNLSSARPLDNPTRNATACISGRVGPAVVSFFMNDDSRTALVKQ
jgi:hypothetical protein